MPMVAFRDLGAPESAFAAVPKVILVERGLSLLQAKLTHYTRIKLSRSDSLESFRIRISN
jgi:hypothetical protein